MEEKNNDVIVKKTRGRPKKYFTPEELKEAKKRSNMREEEKQRRREWNKTHYIPVKERKIIQCNKPDEIKSNKYIIELLTSEESD